MFVQEQWAIPIIFNHTPLWMRINGVLELEVCPGGQGGGGGGGDVYNYYCHP